MIAYPRQTETRVLRASIAVDKVTLHAELSVPAALHGLVILARSGRSRHPCATDQGLFQRLNEAGLATLLLGLLTTEEEIQDEATQHLRFNPLLLSQRLVAVTDWAGAQPAFSQLAIGYFGVGAAVAGAILAATERIERVRALVSFGGRPDLVAARLAAVAAPTLLIVGNDDPPIQKLNRLACSLLRVETHLAVLPGATCVGEPRTCSNEVAELAVAWFMRFMTPAERG